MIAIAFLALLVGCSNAQYSWDGPRASPPETPAPDKGEVCLTDTASCGCCLMQQRMHKMEEFFNMTLDALRSRLENASSALNRVRASRSAASVALTHSRNCLGPFTNDRTIVYQHVFLNLGLNYDLNNGFFIAPRSGVYSISVTLFSDAGTPAVPLQACATLMVNDLQVSHVRDKNTQDQEDSATSVIAYQLNAADTVRVVLLAGCHLCDNANHHNTFTVFLLYSTD